MPEALLKTTSSVRRRLLPDLSEETRTAVRNYRLPAKEGASLRDPEGTHFVQMMRTWVHCRRGGRNLFRASPVRQLLERVGSCRAVMASEIGDDVLPSTCALRRDALCG
jgi:hypothetical protein